MYFMGLFCLIFFFFLGQDATANDIPGDTFEVQGYPTVFFRSASGKTVPYEGDRTKEDIVDFIENNRDKAAPKETVKEESGKDEL